MTLQEIAEMIAEMELPYAYRAFEQGTGQEPPFICYIYTGNVPEPADNTNYARIETLAIELYTDTKDFALEASVEAVLDKYEMVYDREEDWLDDEKMQMTTYTMEVLINGEQDPVRT